VTVAGERDREARRAAEGLEDPERGAHPGVAEEPAEELHVVEGLLELVVELGDVGIDVVGVGEVVARS
jgi:hypothetical protein